VFFHDSEKVILGFIQAATEKEGVVKDFLHGLIDVSALSSLGEGFKETLSLHRARLFSELGVSFKTTNSIESLMVLISRYRNKVGHWRNSSQNRIDSVHSFSLLAP
jgi:hypothetical protein